MVTNNARKKSKLGRPPVDSDELRARVDRCIIDALDAYAADETLTRPEAIRAILADWLRTHGYRISGTAKPSGPATDVVKAMDAAIKDHRKSVTKPTPATSKKAAKPSARPKKT